MPAPASIIAVSGGPQSTPAGKLFNFPLVAKVLDINGNPVSGVTVTFANQPGAGPYCTFGGVNTAVTDVNGLATSAAMTASVIPGNYSVAASAPGVGPVFFSLSNERPGPGANIAAIVAVWATAKSQLATIQADAATVAADLAALEATLATLYSYGAGDVVDWLRTRAAQSRVGYVPYPTAYGPGPIQIPLSAIDATKPQDTRAVDLRPITITLTGQLCQLT